MKHARSRLRTGAMLALFGAGVVLLASCVTTSTWPNPGYYKAYEGADATLDQLAVVVNDPIVFMKTANGRALKGAKAAVLPGEQTLSFWYYKPIPNGYYSSKKPYPLKVKLEARHVYYVFYTEGNASFSFNGVSLTTSGQFVPQVLDCSDDAKVMAIYTNSLSPAIKLKAVTILRDNDSLATIALKDNSKTLRAAAARNLTNITVLEQIAEEDIENTVRDEAKRGLERIAASPSDEGQKDAQAAIGRLKSAGTWDL